MAKAVVGNVSVLAELPQRPGCGWSADAALEAVAALEQLEPLSDALRGPQPAPPAEAAEELSSGEARTSFETALGSDGVLEPGSGAVEVHPNPNPAPNPSPDPNPSPNPNPNPNPNPSSNPNPNPDPDPDPDPKQAANASGGAAAGTPPSFPVEPLRTLARKLLPTQHYGPLLGHLFDGQFHEVALGQPPDESMVGRWGTWRRGACVSFDPAHRGYGHRKYDAVLHGLPLFVETGTFRDACYHYINSPVLFGRVLQVTACSYHDPIWGFKSADGIWGQVHVRDPACGPCRDRNPQCMGDGGEATGDELVPIYHPNPSPSPSP